MAARAETAGHIASVREQTGEYCSAYSLLSVQSGPTAHGLLLATTGVLLSSGKPVWKYPYRHTRCLPAR